MEKLRETILHLLDKIKESEDGVEAQNWAQVVELLTRNGIQLTEFFDE